MGAGRRAAKAAKVGKAGHAHNDLELESSEEFLKFASLYERLDYGLSHLTSRGDHGADRVKYLRDCQRAVHAISSALAQEGAQSQAGLRYHC